MEVLLSFWPPKFTGPGVCETILETLTWADVFSLLPLGEISPRRNDSVRRILTKLKFNVLPEKWQQISHSGCSTSRKHNKIKEETITKPQIKNIKVN